MRTVNLKAILKAALRVACVLPFAATLSLAQQVVNLSAGPSNIMMPDGTSVPMWGYSCGAAVGGSTATCAALNPGTTGWSPVVITIPTGQGLQINLANNLLFSNGNSVPTSITIVGQIGGGLGTSRSTTPSPTHEQLGTSWPVANTPGSPNPTFAPPPQPARVQSFATEVAAGATTSLTWAALRPGTYLIESGTHPSIQGPMGLYGILVVTSAPTVTVTTPLTETSFGTAYPSGGTGTPVKYDAEIPLVFSEIDPVQNGSVSTAVNKAGFSETAVWSGQPNGCGNPASSTYQTCYPPAVNYTPLYYMINGVAFNKTNPAMSVFSTYPAALAAPPLASTNGSVLVRMVNAGVRMHVPAIVGSQTTGQTNATVTGFQLIAEDGNPLPGLPRVQSEVFMAAGKTYDVMINAPVAPSGGTVVPALPIYDRELSLSGNATSRDAGMLAYISVNGAALPTAGALGAAVARADSYQSLVAGQTLIVADPSKGVIANDSNVYGVSLAVPAALNGTVALNANGTFTYVPTGTATTDSFGYCANGTVFGTAGAVCATVTLGPATVESASGITVNNITYTGTTAKYLAIRTPGVLSVDTDGAGYPLKVVATSVAPASPLSVTVDANGGFTASVPGPGTYSFTYKAQNSQGVVSANSATVTLIFPQGSGLNVNVLDGADKTTQITDYRWIIEEDRSFFVDPACQVNPAPSSCKSGGIVPTLGVNFHTSNMPFVAQGCTGAYSCESGQSMLGNPAVCDVGDGICRPDTTGNGKTATFPTDVQLDPTKRYYISILPGDAANPFLAGFTGSDCSNGSANAPSSATCGHGMGGAPISPGQMLVTVITQPSPYPPGKLSVFVFEDDFPLNGEHDGGGGVDVLAPNEPGLEGFQIHLWDAMGGNGDFTGQMTYDMFNQPLSNSLDGTVDPSNGNNACPVTKAGQGITGMIVTCPKYESDGKTLSPLAGQAVIANLMPGRWGVIATPGADRIARGEEWLQTNTLDGQKAHDVFTRIGEPEYFQEYGPASYHVTVGFANPAVINARLASVCAGTDAFLPGQGGCTNTIKGQVVGERLSRTPDERLYGSGSRDTFYWTQCYVSIGDPDGEDFAFAKCDDKGNFQFTGIPNGSWRVTTFDQWNDQLVDGLSTPVAASGGTTVDMGQIAATQWQTNLYTKTFIDDSKDGVYQPKEAGIPFANVAVRLRDGSLENLSITDFTGTANFNETFPLFSWYVVETDTTRYKNTGTHVVYDAGGPADGTAACGATGYPSCGTSTAYNFLANTNEQVPVPTPLRVPGSVYCSAADCGGISIQNGPAKYGTPGSSGPGGSTGRIDPPWQGVEGWQGFPGQNNFLEFGKEPYAAGENGGIKGHVVYASTRPFDDPQMLVQTQWEPLVPHVTINLYQEGFAQDGVTPTLKLVDSTQTTSWDDYAQGFRSDGIPNMNCPGQTTADLFFFSLQNQPQYLDYYNNVLHGTGSTTPLPGNSQYKCYDGMHNWNQLQPAPYDGMYQFPSVTSVSPTTGRPTSTNCTICTANTAVPNTDLYYGLPMLPAGKYVVEVVPPAGYELVKEEDKNILIGDNYIAPVTQQFGGLGNIFILPDQASVASAYNANNPQNPTNSLGTSPSNNIVPAFVPEPTWPCVGESRIVPDYISLYPQSAQVAPFAGATRNLCDRKEVTLSDQMGAIAKFYLYTSTHIASKFTGGITDDFTSEFDPFSPQFGEKFAPPNLPVAVRDWSGTEIGRVYADQWGSYDGMTYSTWEVNPPNPTGYSPTMMIFCMNDPGNGSTPDPAFNPGYSQFCYELPFMPGTTQYLDTPVVPTSAFSEGYNHPDCAYPDATPAVSSVTGDVAGPWVSVPGHTITIKSLGDQAVTNYGYSGPSTTVTPFNQKTITRHYGFGNTQGTVTIGGATATITGWSDTQIQVSVPPVTGKNAVPQCAVQQQAQYGGSTAYCGQLVITAANGKQSVDTVTVTIGGKSPTLVQSGSSIQTAIDNAEPGDLILVGPGVYNELVIMWKPVRLQGVAAVSSVINANTHPAGKLDPWRAKVTCLFGLALNGQPATAGGNTPSKTNTNPYDPTNTYTCGGWPGFTGVLNNPQVDRLPLEGILGWDTTVNGDLAQLLQEPTLLGAYEGSGILVLSKGVRVPRNATTSYYGSGAEAAFPTGTVLLTNSETDCGRGVPGGRGSNSYIANPFPSNFQCNPSSIDGLAITDSSQGGGGIFVHAWGHNLQIANNRVYNNIGTLSGGINVGQGESPDAYLAGTPADSDPGSCNSGFGLAANTQLPYCFDLNVNVHNNYVALNTSIGDELFSGTPAGAGGVSLCTGADFYKFNYNWICGNMSTGDGGGFAHVGYIWDGDVENNTILFNQSLNPTISTNGGGILVMGAAPDGFTAAGVECGSTVADADCAPGLPDGTGPGLKINANLVMGNAAEAGSGGGIRLQSVNGTEISYFPNGTPSRRTGISPWNTVEVTNNIIANNVAGWDGAGISLQDALAVDIVNNTIVSNTTTASAGVLFNTLGSPNASAPGASCQQQTGNPNCAATTSLPQPSGLVAIGNSPNLTATFAGLTIVCPTGHPKCTSFSNPRLYNNVFWQNSAYYIGVGALSPTYQQNIVTLYNAFTTTPAANQPQADTTAANGSGFVITGGTGACTTGTSYWDIGARGDTGPGNHASGLTMAPMYSVLTNASENGAGSNNLLAVNPTVVSEYCNGSRTPPEVGVNGGGWQVPPGISDATVPNPIFSLTPAATVDEGNNWVNMTWGPLSLFNPVSNKVLGNYALAAGSPAIDYIPTSSVTAALAPNTDFFGNPRPDLANPKAFDVGAVEFQGTGGTAVASVSGGPLAFGNVVVGTTSNAQTLTLHNTGTAGLTGINVAVTAPFSQSGGTCTATLNAGSTCTITVVFSPTTAVVSTGSATITGSVTVAGSPVTLTGTGVAAVTSATLTPASWTVSHARNCPGTGFLGVLACSLDPAQGFTLTNTGNVTLTGITQGTLGGTAANVANYAIVPLLSTCGSSRTTLAPGATCTVTVQFKPLTAQTTGLKPATVSVTDSAGTQTSTLNGTAQ